MEAIILQAKNFNDMKRIYFIATAVAVILSFGACDKKNPEKPVAPASGANEFLVKANDYSNWTYVNLKTGQTETHRDFSDWNYYKVDMQNGTKEFVRKENAKGSLSDVKIEWHIAIHPKAIRTNDTEAAISESTDLKTATVPVSGFVKDGELKDNLIVDLSGMMSGLPIGYAASAKGNKVLNKWLKKTPVQGEHGKYTYELSDKVFFVKCKDGSLVKIKFADYRNAEGEKGFCKFSSLPVVQK